MSTSTLSHTDPPGERTDPPDGSRRRLTRLLRGPAGAPGWVRPAVFLLLAGTAVLYLWDLGASDYANTFYAAAVQAGTQSWKALFFGSLDSASSITVDKPPASLWVMGLSGRIFGFSSWSMLAPQALEGVASVGLLYAAVRRWSGPVAGLLAGAGLALTPVAVLMFRFDNPDALLVLLLVAGAYCVVRATEKASTWWLVLAGTALGFGFLTKMLQAFLVLPAFALVYLIAAPTGLWRRVWQLSLSGLAVLVSAGWWVLAVALWPAASRPYIGGSTNNSVLELAFGYNGLSRVLGNSGGPGGGGGGPGGGGNASFGGASGLTRLFGDAMGTQISWLLPAALIALVAGLWFTRRAPRTDRTRAALVLWGGWLLVSGLVFSYMQGIIHPYYMIALAPAIGALVAVAGRELWRGRDHLPARIALAAMVAVTGVWDYQLLSRTPDWAPALRYLVLVASVLVTLLILVGTRRLAKLATALVCAAVVAGATGSAAYAVDTAATPHGGSIPAAGPAGQGGPGGGFAGGPPNGAQFRVRGEIPAGARFGGGPDGGQNSSSQLTALLTASRTTWAAATMGSQQAATLELATGKAVMAIGGFSGGDPSPTLAQFEQDVAAGKIHYFVSGGGMGGGPGGEGAGNAISSWVASHFSSITVGNQTVYDLTSR